MRNNMLRINNYFVKKKQEQQQHSFFFGCFYYCTTIPFVLFVHHLFVYFTLLYVYLQFDL